MNFYFVLTLFVILSELKCCQSKEDFIPLAISEIVKNYYLKNSMRFDFITDFDDRSMELKDQLEETIKLSSTVIGVESRSMNISEEIVDYPSYPSLRFDFDILKSINEYIAEVEKLFRMETHRFLKHHPHSQSGVFIVNSLSNFQYFDCEFL